MNSKKNSVKLLPIIEQFEKYTAFYTEFDSKFEEGDKLYIMIVDSGTTDFVLDSFETSGTTYNSIGYKLLKKEKNKIILDIIYETVSGITITENNAYIGRIYIKEGNIKRGSIDGAMLYNVTLQPVNLMTLLWNQGILVSSPSEIKNILFNSKTSNELVLKSVINDGIVENYYTNDNYYKGLSIINLSYDILNLNGCNINAGTFNDCYIVGSNRIINNGEFNECIIGATTIINNGEFNNCEMDSNSVKWNNGIWDYTEDSGTTSSFKTIIWKNGIWRNGIFPNTSIWENGYFLNGDFNGLKWNSGVFGSLDNEPIFNSTTWENGFFFSGEFTNSSWENGTFDGGIFTNNSIFYSGEFNGGQFIDSTWLDGEFNNGVFSGSTWINGNFNNGEFIDSTWENGNFNSGLFTISIWKDGVFYDGYFEDSTWYNGIFHNGSMFNSTWLDGEMYFGIINNTNWSGGTWYNGIANNIIWASGIWYNGVWNFSEWLSGTWYNGSFNSNNFGVVGDESNSIWMNGNFYEGEFNGVWNGGTFFIGKDTLSAIPNENKLKKKYVQYNRSGLVIKKSEFLKLPSKKRF